MIKKGDIVFHKLSNLYYICENSKMERWMNMNPFYEPCSENLILPSLYFKKY